ncbi:ankyrin repeat-containing domain protein [Gorgonomyces haynaldii]|nr:ankyrin repeat-containing domain protein [Gorgonomyces haynaldii]
MEVVLHCAMSGRDQMLAHVLADPRCHPGWCQEAVVLACEAGHVKTLQTLLDCPGFILSEDSAPIHACVQEDSPACLQVLLKNRRSKPNFQCLYLAVENEMSEMVQMLLKDSRVDPSENDDELLDLAATSGNSLSIVQMLMDDTRVDPTSHFFSAIEGVINQGLCAKNIVQLFLNDERVDPSLFNNSPFKMACAHALSDIVQWMLCHPLVDPAHNHNEALQLAAQKGHLDIVKLLCADSRVNPDDRNKRALKLARLHGHIDVVRCLLH